MSERTVELSLVQATWESRQTDAETYEFSLLLNKEKAPEERIGFGLATINADPTKEKDQGKDVIVHFGHPQIWKEFQKVLTKLNCSVHTFLLL